MRNQNRSSPALRRGRNRRLLLEALESRVLLDADGLPWSAPNLTISFVPDGTNVAGYPSSLFADFAVLADSAAWQDAIMRGFETWAQYTAASISKTGDSGDPLGTPGPTQGDPRFGDVRVAAIPMAQDIIAMSVPHDEVISGTWAGDILFNSNAHLNSVDEIFAIAVHEAGHVFGLGHSTDPASPMFLHGITPAVIPTSADIGNLQRLYGVPENDTDSEDGDKDGDQPSEHEDEHEREHGDDQLDTANSVMLSANFQGAIRYEAAGKIFDATDVDFYQFAPIDDEFEKSDVLTVAIRATTRQGLIPSAKILDQEGEIVESTVLTNANGEFVIQAVGVDPRKPHFVEVRSAASNGRSTTGTYDLVATFGTRSVTLDQVAAGTLDPEASTLSAALHVHETQLVHLVLAIAPDESSTPSLAWTAIYDPQGNPVFRVAASPGESRSANTLLLTPGDYRIEFHSESLDGVRRVQLDYRLLSRSIALPIGPDPIDPTAVPILPCSDPASDPVYCYPNEVTVVDPFILPDPTRILLPEPVVLITSPWADPDTWYWDGVSPPTDIPAPIGSAKPAPSIAPTPAIKPAVTPTVAPPPVVSPPVVSPPVAPPAVVSPPIATPTTAGPPTVNLPNNAPASIVETGSLPLGAMSAGWRNVDLPHDVNADRQVSPVDALLVINFLNASGTQLLSGTHPSGSPFLDVNSDGFASPLDALMVINELNRSAWGAPEGESSSPLLPTRLVAATATPAPVLQNASQREFRVASKASVMAESVSTSRLFLSSSLAAVAGRSHCDAGSSLQSAIDDPALEEAIRLIATDRITLLRP